MQELNVVVWIDLGCAPFNRWWTSCFSLWSRRLSKVYESPLHTHSFYIAMTLQSRKVLSTVKPNFTIDETPSIYAVAGCC